MQPKFVWCGLALLAGVWSIGWWTPIPWTALLGAGISSVMAILFNRYRLSDVLLLLAAFCLGCWIAMRPQPADCSSNYIRGTVERSSGYRALVSSPCGRWELNFSTRAPDRGSNIAAMVKPRSPKPQLPGEPSEVYRIRRMRAVSARVLHWSIIGSSAVSIPSRFKNISNGGLLWAFASGKRDHIKPSTKELFRNTGIYHLLAISGMHIGLIAAMVYGIFKAMFWPLVTRGWYWLVLVVPRVLACFAAYFYGSIVMWPSSAKRAFLMVVVFSFSRILGRRFSLHSVLTLIAVLIVNREPSELSHLGFQLSFSAVMGIALFVPRVTRLFPPDTPIILIRIAQSVGVTIGATLGTLGLSSWYFQEVYPASPISNLLATPVFAFIAVPCALLGFVLPEPLASWSLAIGDSAIQFGVHLLTLLPQKVCHPAVGASGAVMLFSCLILRRKEWLMMFCIVLVIYLKPFPNPHLEVLFLNVGQGDASLVSWPDGRHWLIDGGPSRNAVLRYLRRKRIAQLDVVALSHFHADHANGILGIQEIPIREMWIPHWPGAHNEEWLAWLVTKSMEGTVILLPNQINHKNIRVLHPLDETELLKPTPNNQSLVLELNHAGRRILWTGDIDRDIEQAIHEKLLPVDILKVAHHGSRHSTSPSFLRKTTPKYAVISNGQANAFGHPHPETIWRLRNSDVLRTDQHQTIRARLSGNAIRFSLTSPENQSDLVVTDH